MSAAITSKVTTTRALAFFLIVAILYILVTPTHPIKSDISHVHTNSHESSHFSIETSLVDPAGDKIHEAPSANQEYDTTGKFEIEEETEEQEEEEEEESVGEVIAAAVEAVDEEQLTEEEKAVQEYHQKHGQNQPTRDRPKVPTKANSKSASKAAAIVTETTLPEIRHLTWTHNASAAHNLILVIADKGDKWGHTGGSAANGGNERTFESFLEFVNDTSGLPMNTISMAILTTSEKAYKQYNSTMVKYPLAKSQVLLYQPKDHTKDSTDRHDVTYRKHLAAARNTLMLRALGDESNIFWYDPKIVASDSDILAKMISQAASTPKLSKNTYHAHDKPLPVGLLTTRCQETHADHDLDSWSRRSDNQTETRSENQVYMQDLTSSSTDDEVFSLDAVSGSLLYMRADLVRKGLSFPAYSVFGKPRDTGSSIDGVETEGICWLAEQLGHGCYGLGGKWHVARQE